MFAADMVLSLDRHTIRSPKKQEVSFVNRQISVKTGVSEGLLRPGKVQKVYVMLEITAPEGLESQRTPVNVGFVLDRSGSMSGDKLEYTKKAVAFAVGHMGEKDIMALVVFDDEVQSVLPAKKVINKDVIKNRISGIQPGGCTNLSGGFSKGFREIKKNLREEIVNRVLLLTDGQANVGLTDHRVLVRKAREYAAKGVTLTTIGVGDDFEEGLLTAMADAGKGNFYYIENTDEIPQIFAQELQGLLSMVAHNLHLTISAPADVKVTGILGYEPEFGATVEIDLPDMYANESKKLLLELEVGPCPEGIHNLVGVKLTYDGVLFAQGNVEVDMRIDITVSSTEDNKKDWDVLREVESYRITRAKEEAVRLADDGDFESSRYVLREQVQSLAADDDLRHDPRIIQEMSDLEGNIALLAEKADYKIARKQMNYQIYRSRRSKK